MRRKLPGYRLHKASGQAVVSLNGRDFYLGRHGSEASKAAYDRLTGEWIAGGRKPIATADAGPTVAEVFAQFWAWCDGYYRKDDRPTTQIASIKNACKDLVAVYGDLPADAFGPSRLKALMAKWVERGDSRVYINRRAGLVRQMFSWAASEELIPGGVVHSLKAVRLLVKGRTTAPEKAPVGPVDDATAEATIARLPAHYAAMARVQWLAGMRPGEVAILRPMDVDRSGEVWVYAPASHKTQHHNRGRVILLGPRARAVLAPRLEGCRPEWYAFKPVRKRTPVDVSNYRRAIYLACDRAGVPRWHPNQLRHSAATRIRREHGIELARIVLGHSTLTTTLVYAEADLEKARAIVAEGG